MSTNGSVPTRESILVTWSQNLSTKVSAAPASVGLSAGQATGLATATSDWVSAYNTAITPETRSKITVEAKNIAKRAYLDEARPLIAIMQAYPAMTNDLRIELGLKVRDGEATPINPPTEPPIAEITSVFGRIVRGRVHSTDTETRGKPTGVAACWMYTFVGAAPPADIAAWKFEGSSTRTIWEIEFPATVPAGSQFWLCAQWINPRNQPGPACSPITSFLGGGVEAEAA